VEIEEENHVGSIANTIRSTNNARSFTLDRSGLQQLGGLAPYYSVELLLFNFVASYVLSSPRIAMGRHGLDHNVAPREDLARYGTQALSSGKITTSQLDAIKRSGAAQANAIENFSLFVAGMTMSTLGGVDSGVVNVCGLSYTLARIAYTFAYVRATTETASYVRSVLWWVGNGSCFYLLWSARGLINAG
jgi:uncharacterized MAPEG superfamily protein